ncbi:hypothetical protein CR513_04073, partial [Mucuna pruriens]
MSNLASKLKSLKSLFEIGNARFLEEVEFEKEENIRNVIFEQEFANNISQETTPIIEDNVQTIIIDIVLEQDYDEIDVKTVFLNGDIDETIYMVQPENYVSDDSKSMSIVRSNLNSSQHGNFGQIKLSNLSNQIDFFTKTSDYIFGRQVLYGCGLRLWTLSLSMDVEYVL